MKRLGRQPRVAPFLVLMSHAVFASADTSPGYWCRIIAFVPRACVTSDSCSLSSLECDAKFAGDLDQGCSRHSEVGSALRTADTMRQYQHCEPLAIGNLECRRPPSSCGSIH